MGQKHDKNVPNFYIYVGYSLKEKHRLVAAGMRYRDPLATPFFTVIEGQK